jgi:hypothetical protein
VNNTLVYTTVVLQEQPNEHMHVFWYYAVVIRSQGKINTYMLEAVVHTSTNRTFVRMNSLLSLLLCSSQNWKTIAKI